MQRSFNITMKSLSPLVVRSLSFNRPGASEVLTAYLLKCNEPPWTSYFVKYSSVKDDQFGMSNFNWKVGKSNYQILRTGCFPYIKYHCSKRKEENLKAGDRFMRVIKVVNLDLAVQHCVWTGSTTMIGAVIVGAALVLLVRHLLKKAYERHENFPPGPPSLPVYGAYWIVLANSFYSLSEAFIKLGKRYKTSIVGCYLGPIPTMVINDPYLIKQMLYTESFDGRMDIILGRLRSFWKKLGIFFTDGYYWHVQRRFSLRYMRDYGFGRRDATLESVVANEIREMVDIVRNGPKYPAEKEVVKRNLVHIPLIFANPFINGMNHVFARMNIPRSQYQVLWEMNRKGLLFQRSSDDVGRALTLTPWLKDVMPTLSGYKGLRLGNQFFLDYFQDLINDTKKTHNPAHDRHFLDMYLTKMYEEQKSGEPTTFSEEQLILTCTDYMFPTATALGMVLAFLIERMLLQPGIQEKVHEEIDRVVGRDRAPDDRQNMPYTEACLREMMRFETVVPLGLPHRALEDVNFAGYDIPEGTFIAANYVCLHTDKEIWGDPENFRPERFIANGELKVSSDKSLPFGAGRRLCAGETYARQCLFQVFAGFMQAFRVETADGKPLKKPAFRIPGIITTISEFWVKVIPRS